MMLDVSVLKRHLLGDDPEQPAAGDGLGLRVITSTPNSTSTSPEIVQSQYNESPITKSTTSYQGSPISNRQSITRQKTVRSRAGPPRGIRAPRCSLASDLAVPQIRSIRSSTSDSSKHSSRTIRPDEMQQAQWKNYDIPQELELVFGDAPQEICNIVQESLDEHRALRASRLEPPLAAILKPVEIAPQSPLQMPPTITESSTMASARASPASSRSRRTGSTSSVSQDSFTSVESENGLDQLLHPPKVSGHSAMGRSSESLSHPSSPKTPQSPKPSLTHGVGSHLALVETKLQESKDRWSKSHKLYKLLPGRMLKAIPSPDFMKAEPPPVECTSCFDEISHRQAVQGLPCRHSYCSSCFSQLISTAILNEDTFPPRCCLQEVPKTVMRNHLAVQELAKYDEKALEYAVAVGSRYYCVSPECGRWIDTRNAKRTNGALECPHCTVKLCTVCRGLQHPSNEDCPQDYGLDATLEQAERSGWRRCYRCRAMVELNTGCRHITCKCRAEFCYTCGAIWRTCACTEADQTRREQELEARRIQFDADARAEEEEVRAAIAAVEAAERRLQEEREAEERRLEEEARELSRRELDRVQRITKHFETLRMLLDKMCIQQRQAIEKRHNYQDEQLRKMEEETEAVKAEKEREIWDEKDSLVAQNKGMLKALQREHASAMMETITRHRKAQDDLLTKPAEGSDPDAEIVKAAILEELMPAQEFERTTLKQQQAREIQKWKTRGERTVNAFDTTTMIQQMRAEETEKIAQHAGELKKTHYADLQWFEAIITNRATMLGEDEKRLVLSGGDAPRGQGIETAPEKTPENEGMGFKFGLEATEEEKGKGGARTTWHQSPAL